MRLAKFHARTATLACLILGGASCQTAQKPVSLLPPGSAPGLSAPAAAPASEKSASAKSGSSAATAKQPQQAKPDSSQKSAQSTPANPVQNASAPTSAISDSSDPIADLVARVEKEYQAGVVNYQAGNTDAAKQNFDNAFNALLGSNLDVRSDDRLQKEFDRVVEGVNQLGLDSDGLGGSGMDAGSNADAEPQQKSEPAPIDETNGLTPSADASVKAKAQAEIKNTHSDLPLMM
ncbi:MAG TPA: hypothetical protein VIX19_00725, partial [Terriglobales bacterium]